MKENEQVFKGTQEQMCEAALLGLNLYDKDQPQFQKINLKYTKEWSSSLRKEITDALAMPDVHTRRSVPAGKRSQLIVLGQDCTDTWLILSGLISDIATAGEKNALLIMAGGASYEEATKNNWIKTKALMQAGSDFIKNREEWLLNNGAGMSPEFPEAFNAAKAAFDKGAGAFYNAKQDMPSETLTKVDALNNVYRKLTAMLNDGKKIYRRNRVKRESYNYTKLLTAVRGVSGVSGVRIMVKVGEILVPITTATASFIPTGKSFEANSKGVILCKLPAGSYEYTITAPGFQTYTSSIIITSGVVSRAKAILEKAGAGSAIA